MDYMGNDSIYDTGFPFSLAYPTGVFFFITLLKYLTDINTILVTRWKTSLKIWAPRLPTSFYVMLAS